MGKILITRKWSIVGFPKYNIYLDNTYVGQIANGGQFELDVYDGNHQICLQNSLISFGFKSKVLSFNTINLPLIRMTAKSTFFHLSGIKFEFEKNSFNSF